MSVLRPSYQSQFAQQLCKSASRGRTALRGDIASYWSDSSVKRAAIGGEIEANFERSFASLAFTYMQDKAPTLLDYMVGFQLVDRTDDNKRAVGIFGFKVGDQWIYAPVFFLSGDLKGHELMYLKNQDTFVPLKENWVNYLMSKRPQILGKGTSQTPKQLGMLEPDLNSLRTPPSGGKFASDMRVPPRLQEWAKSAMSNLGSWATVSPKRMEKYAGLDARLDMRKVLAADIRLIKLAVKASSDYPGVKAAFDDLYGSRLFRNLLLDMQKAAVASEKMAGSVLRARSAPLAKSAAADEFKKLEVITDRTITQNIPDMSESDREKLLRDGYLIHDHRDGDEVSVAYNTQVQLTLVNPDTTDVYDVLVRPDGYKRCLVVHNPVGGKGRNNFVTLIGLEGKNKWENCKSGDVFVKEQARSKSDVEEYADWFEGLSDVGLSVDAKYSIVSDRGSGTCVFKVLEKVEDDLYRVDWEDYCSDVCRVSGDGPYYSDNFIRMNQRKGSTFRVIGGVLYVPPNTKAIKVSDAPKCEKCKATRDECDCNYFHSDYSSSHELHPGNLVDIQSEFLRKTAQSSDWSQLKVWTDGHEVFINSRRMAKLASLIHLVQDHGLRVKQARYILREADRLSAQPGGAYRCVVKYAQPYSGDFGPYEAMQGPSAGSFPEPTYGTDPAYGGIPSQQPQSEMMNVPDMSAANTDPSTYDNSPESLMDPMAMQVASQGQQQGQKEIFDTTMVASLLRAIREDTIVDRYLGDLVKALDRLGRILFQFYWHNDQFRDRYGKQDMPELEDTIRNSFEVLGDLVLFLKEKTIGPLSPGEMGSPVLQGTSS